MAVDLSAEEQRRLEHLVVLFEREQARLQLKQELKRYAIHHSRRTYADHEALHLEAVKAQLEMQGAIHDLQDGHTADAGGAQADP